MPETASTTQCDTRVEAPFGHCPRRYSGSAEPSPAIAVAAAAAQRLVAARFAAGERSLRSLEALEHDGLGGEAAADH